MSLAKGKSRFGEEKVRAQSDNGFSLAELWHFHWLDLMLGKKKFFCFCGVVKW